MVCSRDQNSVVAHVDSLRQLSQKAKCLKVKWMKFQTIHLSETHFYFNFKFVKDRLDHALASVLKVSRCAV